ncbi:McrB family protein [Flavobacterium sp.]|uniref:McrB family protein n=1 Tax=Flavobacterium sp. TaxID=239 RepID=UPI003D29C4CD
MISEDLKQYLVDVNNKSKFKALLSERGGYISFSNTSDKYFVLGLDSFILIIKDILNNTGIFYGHQTYVEKEWRDLGALHFKDPAANAIVTVQTKPLFTTISKLILWANKVDINLYSDNEIDLNENILNTTIQELENLAQKYEPKIASSLNNIIFEKQKLKWIIFNSFKYLLKNHDVKLLLKNSKIKESQINETKYSGISIPDYFNSDNLIGQFKTEQLKEQLTSSNTIRYFEDGFTILENDFSYFSTQWGDVEGNGLTLKNFNRYLSDITNNTLEIIKEGKLYSLIFINKNKSPLIKTENTIYYGAPGTGKSFKVDKIIEILDPKYYERITFHPEYDNSSFIGGYKPISFKNENGDDIIKYEFVPQAFTNIYERAWKDLENQYYLVIEEINRGNCAEIFGEIFQLLDRTSNYTVSPAKELKEYLINEAFKDRNHLGVINGLKLPPNLSILATMNTSDQSLFPMDSAFKRRWDWEYIPICYAPEDDFGKDNDSFNFEIDIEDGKQYSWIKFIEKVNLNHIKNNPSLGMDKCIGNYFIKPDKDKTITLKPFINKVLFYLWNDVFKDEDDKVFEENTSYEDFFPINTNGKKKIKELFDRIELQPKKSQEVIENDSQLGQATEAK